MKKNITKRLLAALLATALAFSLTACGGGNDAAGGGETSESGETASAALTLSLIHISQTTGLTEAVGTDIPEADVYIALTFDDGPTGALGGYPNGLTATLLDGLKERGAHATFFMVGNRVNMFSGAMQRLAAEGHESVSYTHLDVYKRQP